MRKSEEGARQLAAMLGDFGPVRPMVEPWRAALVVVPYCVALAAAALIFVGPGVGILTAPRFYWSASTLELAVAVALFLLVRRQATPGRASSMPCLAVSGAAALALQVLVAWASYLQVPTTVAATSGAANELFCAVVRLLSGVGPVALVCWWTWRGLALRPLTGGWLGAVGAGLSMDAVWRLQCSYTHPEHFLIGHLMPLLPLAAFGVLLQWAFIARHQGLRRRKR